MTLLWMEDRGFFRVLLCNRVELCEMVDDRSLLLSRVLPVSPSLNELASSRLAMSSGSSTIVFGCSNKPWFYFYVFLGESLPPFWSELFDLRLSDVRSRVFSSTLSWRDICEQVKL
jgi:hypothetical protein